MSEHQDNIAPLPTASEANPDQATFIRDLYERRRRALPSALQGHIEADRKPWGLALSGGGIRSATFCFGLVSALARRNIFHQFDILSTVSGGGYIGSTIGKLYHHATPASGQDASTVEQSLGTPDTRWFAIWLRANGRYLIPKGTDDVLFAAANFARNLIGVHVELAVLSLMLGSLLVGFDLLVWGLADGLYNGTLPMPAIFGDWGGLVSLLDFVALWPTLWILLPIPLYLCAVLSCAYWMAPPSRKAISGAHILTALFALIGIALIVSHKIAVSRGLSSVTGSIALPLPLVCLAIALLSAWIVGLLLASFKAFTASPEAMRNALTRSLANAIRVALVIILLGLVDYVAWIVANPLSRLHGILGGALVLLAVGLRAAVPRLANLPKNLTPFMRNAAMSLISIAGMILAIALLVFWVSVIHGAVTLALFPDQEARTEFFLKFSPAVQWLLWISVPTWLYALTSHRNFDFLNRSSLFTFYRARLVRSYLGAANGKRFSISPGAPKSPLEKYTSETPFPVTEVLDGDDVPLAEYAPNENGGPIHLINVCANQTRDPRGALFNQDRKGLLLTVGPKGYMSFVPDRWSKATEKGAMTLGAWMSISGAAVAPGLGASTRSGISAILMAAGVRLGYWWDSYAGLPLDDLKRKRSGKYAAFVDEFFGRFDGTSNREWFLTDGGHFENTGAYTLLREGCEIVMVADCGADPRYAFGDLENLVRKARIDLQAEITFLRPNRSGTTQAPSRFGSLNDIASPNSQACVALARINYRRLGTKGYMFIVKPNMSQGLSVDLVNFKADNPLFPQEPTTDQCFSEAQWESYFELGKALGSTLHPADLENAAGLADLFVIDDGAIALMDSETGATKLSYATTRLSSRIASTGVVSATVGFGALTTFGFGVLQAMQQRLDAGKAAERIDPIAFKELTDLFGKMTVRTGSQTVVAATASSGTQVGEMATALLRFGDVVCNDDNASAFRRSSLMKMMVVDTKAVCKQYPALHPSCSRLTEEILLTAACLQSDPRKACRPMYWTRSYSTPRNSSDAGEMPNCPEKSIPVQLFSYITDQMSTHLEQSGVTRTVKETGEANWSSTAPVAPGAPMSSFRECDRKTIFIRIYGPSLGEKVLQYRAPWKNVGATISSVEDVWESARRAGTRSRIPYEITTVLYHNEQSKECALALQGAAQAEGAPWDVKPLSESYAGNPNAIEVWIAPQTKTN
ncbi:patatin-like phospholipase family protein [Cupriavidus pampae]|uniref:PNPLA domain-containing protein n=1 Tax=Cupriavidus pampae TaxID=659251 RepID=A0ABM8WYC0_9BURK|nr:patatin-like phospholipase family protein [Cupriavidus pampae]CAG9172571.1 hypothetical protein LMG32289_02624 [Cupriavidus pampae]